MLFTIITPCFNSDRFISRTIESILSQEGDLSIQYVVADGGSSDQSLPIIQEYIGRLQKKTYPLRCKHLSMQLIPGPDKGMYDAIAKGLKEVKGDITAYLNADDIYFPSALRTVKEIFEQHPHISWLSGRHVKIDAQDHKTLSFLPFSYKRDMILKGLHGSRLPYIQQETIFWRSSMNRLIDMQKLGHFKLAGDFYLWHTFASSEQLYICDRELAAFRTHEEQLSVTRREAYEKEFRSIVQDHVPLPPASLFMQQLMNYRAPEWFKKIMSPHILSTK
jgi:glycosyltransferase involved in cell wall biosynthesis